MQCKYFIFGFLATVAVSESVLLRPTVKTPSRRGSWRSNTLSLPVPKGRGRARSRGTPRNNKLSHSLSLSNLNIKPGQTKVITQTIVVRRRFPNGQLVQGKPVSNNRQRGRSGRGFHSVPNSPRITSAHGQRGVHSTFTPNIAGPRDNGLYLISRIPPESQWNLPSLDNHNGLANIQLPVIDLSRVAPTRHSLGINGAISSPSQSVGQHPSEVNGIRPAVYQQHSIHNVKNTGINTADITRALLAGNPEVIVVQDPVSTPVSVSSKLGQNTNDLNQLKIGVGVNHLSFNSKLKATGVVANAQNLPGVQTTMEPGEDPPEVR